MEFLKVVFQMVMSIQHLKQKDGRHFGRISNDQDYSPNHLKTDRSIIQTIQKLDMSGFRIPIVLDTQILEIFKKYFLCMDFEW